MVKTFAEATASGGLTVADSVGASAAIDDKNVVLRTHAGSCRLSCALKDAAVVQTLFAHNFDLTVGHY